MPSSGARLTHPSTRTAFSRRLFLRYASAPFGVSGIVLQVNPHVGHSCPHPPMVISPCPLGHSPLRMRKSLSIYRSLSPGFPPSTSIRSGSARSISIFSPFKTRITQRSFGPARKAAQSAQLSVMPPSSIQAVQIQIQFDSPCKKSCSCAVNQRNRCHHAIGYKGFEHQ